MDYIITSYPCLIREYLITDVSSEKEAWEKYFNTLPEVHKEYYDSESDGLDIKEVDIKT